MRAMISLDRSIADALNSRRIFTRPLRLSVIIFRFFKEQESLRNINVKGLSEEKTKNIFAILFVSGMLKLVLLSCTGYPVMTHQECR